MLSGSTCERRLIFAGILVEMHLQDPGLPDSDGSDGSPYVYQVTGINCVGSRVRRSPGGVPDHRGLSGRR